VTLLPELRAYARFLARDVAEADDLVQEAIVRALAALSDWQQGTNLRAWLLTILRNTFYEQSRRRRTEQTILAQSPAGHEAEAPEQHSKLDLADLQRHLFALPPLQREALMLVGAHGLSHEDAAAICNVPVGTMKARVSRARAQLARAMRQALPTET
jgi:RNA polymerase sigma-70 factor (ECF subfamily)